MATNISQDDWHKTGLRLPKDLHVRLHDGAAASGRSYNSEIVERLRASFDTAVESKLALLATLNLYLTAHLEKNVSLFEAPYFQDVKSRLERAIWRLEDEVKALGADMPFEPVRRSISVEELRQNLDRSQNQTGL